MITPETPVPAVQQAAGTGPIVPVRVGGNGTVNDAADIAAMLADDKDIEAHRQAIAARHAHALDSMGPVMLTLSRIAGLAEQLGIEARLLARQLGGAS